MLNNLLSNLKWNFNKQFFTYLVGKPTTLSQMRSNISNNVANLRLTNGMAKVDTCQCLCSLNDIALGNYYNDKLIRHLYDKQWNNYRSVAKSLAKVELPTSGSKVRICSLVDNYIRCSQLLLPKQFFDNYKAFCHQLLQLTDDELCYFDDVYKLKQCQYFVASCRLSWQGNSHGLLNLMPRVDVSYQAILTSNYSNNSYVNNRLSAVVDCMGNSAVMLENCTCDNYLNATITANKRSVFDTFCYHRYGKLSSSFFSRTATMQCYLQYFLRENCEVRNYKLVSNTSNNQRFDLSFNCGTHSHKGCSCSYFTLENSHCVAVSGDKNYFVAYVAIDSNEVVPISCSQLGGNGCHMQLQFSTVLGKNDSKNLSIVTIYASSMSQLVASLKDIQTIGFALLIGQGDSIVIGNKHNIVTCLTPCNNMFLPSESRVLPQSYSYNYRFGDSSISTMLDNEGNAVTLLDGFLFGIGGERIYAVNNSVVSCVNSGKFTILDNGYSQSNGSGVTLTVEHNHAKTLSLTSSEQVGLLFVLPLEEKSKVEAVDHGFIVTSSNRSWRLTYYGKLTSFSTNAIECNNGKLRHKLSGDLTSGTALNMYFSSVSDLKIEIVNINKLPISRSMIASSILGVCLDYHNENTCYNMVNKLKPITALELASLVYSNSKLVKQYLLYMEANGKALSGSSSYYSSEGQLVTSHDKFTYCLALLQYCAIVGDLSLLNENRIKLLQCMLLTDVHSIYDKCIQALCLKKMALLDIDKVNALVRLSVLRSQLEGSKDSYSMAQAVGCVDIVSCSKQRIKQLVASNNLPKSWYYVSQLENLYGINVVGSRVAIKPKCGSDSLEKLLISIGDNKLHTTFNKESNYSMKLDGSKCYSAVDLSKITSGSHDLSVNY